jgi:hypothetical protein
MAKEILANLFVATNFTSLPLPRVLRSFSVRPEHPVVQRLTGAARLGQALRTLR